MLPYYPAGGSAGGHEYNTTTWSVKLVADYTGLNFTEVRALEYVEFLTYRRDAFIHRLSQTDAGQEYLDNAWRMEQTTPDREALRKKLRKEETQDGE
jgi:hypothetical protein